MIRCQIGATDNQAESALLNIGVKLSNDKSFLCISSSNPNLNRLFQGTKWYGNNWSKSLSRLPKSEKKAINLHGKTVHGIKVYLGNIFTEEDDAE